MIDWLNVFVPIKHTANVTGGIVSKINADGEREWEKVSPRPVAFLG